MPTRSMMYGGSPSPTTFRNNGREYLEYFINVAGLRPTDCVVDIGSGDGRKAVALTRYLTTGTYLGLDPVKVGIEWCAKTITPRFPHFKFKHIDVFNGQYNPGGSIRPCDTRLPVADAEADFVIVTSVFTHMLPNDVDHYLSEIARILSRDGCTFTSWFLLTPAAAHRVAHGTAASSAPRFGTSNGTFAVENPAVPEQAIAYEESWVTARCREHGLIPRVDRGWWSGAAETTGYQDHVILSRAAQ